MRAVFVPQGPGTPRPFFAALRRQPNSTEKSVNATISCAEQRPFKTPQLPALRAVVSEPALQKRRFFLLLYFQQVWSPSIWGWKRAPAAVADFRTRARQGLQTCFGGHGCLPAPTRPTQRLTRPNGGGIVGGSMAEEKMASSLLTVYQNPAGRRVYSRAAPGFFSLSFGPRAAKSGSGPPPRTAPGV